MASNLQKRRKFFPLLLETCDTLVFFLAWDASLVSVFSSVVRLLLFHQSPLCICDLLIGQQPLTLLVETLPRPLLTENKQLHFFSLLILAALSQTLLPHKLHFSLCLIYLHTHQPQFNCKWMHYDFLMTQIRIASFLKKKKSKKRLCQGSTLIIREIIKVDILLVF